LYATNDKLFKLNYNSTYQTDWFSFFKTSTKYNRSFLPEHLQLEKGNTPFYFDEKEQLETNKVTETFTFYYLSPFRYRWDVSSGMDWVRGKQLDYRTSMHINPSNKFNMTLNYGYRIEQKIFDPLTSTLRFRPHRKFSTSLQANYNTMIGKLSSLSNTLKTETGDRWEDRWIFSARFSYQPLLHRDYQLHTLSVTKDLHRRKLIFTYDRILEEYRLTFKIDAFPEDSIGFSKNKNSTIEIEGVFDDESIQRF